jgi:carbon monoxide dehydrogenase subunit G
MKIEQTVEVHAPVDKVWALVNDVPRVAPCMPGAQLTKVVDDTTYEGTVQVKLGPIRMSYKGTVVLENVDEASHTAQLSAKGRDVKGSGTATAAVVCTMEAVGADRTNLNVSSDVQLTGKVASFGRGAISDVAGKLFGQFADCLRDTLNADGDAPAADAPAGGTPPATDTEAPHGGAGSGDATAAPAAPAQATAVPPTGTTTPPPRPAPRPAQAREAAPLDAGGLIRTVVVGRAKSIAETIGHFIRGLRVRLARKG